MLDAATREALLRRARAAIARAIGADPAAAADRCSIRRLCRGRLCDAPRQRHLRGCIGYPEADLPLVEVVERCAVSAASPIRDFRRSARQSGIRSIWNLGARSDRAGRGHRQIEIGRHGLIVESGGAAASFCRRWRSNGTGTPRSLPRRPCLKAGLPRDAWRNGATLFKFEAEVFRGRLLQET